MMKVETVEKAVSGSVEVNSTGEISYAENTTHSSDAVSGLVFDKATNKKTIDAVIAEKRAKETGQCFDGETHVHTPDGPIEIKGFRVGDLVLSRCEKTGERAYRKVLQVFKHEYDYDDPNAVDIQQYAVRYMLPNGEIGGVYVTGEHPFWVNGMGWVDALQLQAGQELEICDIEAMGEQCDQYRKLGPYSEVILQDRGWTAKVVSVTKTPITKCTVYNLEVEEFHTYFVDSTGIWVHNKDLEKPIDVFLERTNPAAEPIGFKAGTTENPYDGLRIRLGENTSPVIKAEHGGEVVNIPYASGENKTGKNGK